MVNKLDVKKHIVEHQILKTADKEYVDNEVHWERTGTGVHLKASTDDVGIGTSTPGRKIDIISDATTPDSIRVNHFSSEDNQFNLAIRRAKGTSSSPLAITQDTALGGIIFQGYDGGQFRYSASILSAAEQDYSPTQRNATLQFLTSSGTAANEKMRITGAGNVGIGTTTPDTKLQVVGDCKFGDDNTNYASMSSTGDLTFTGTGKYLVEDDKYAFQSATDNDVGLFFNAGGVYEFRDTLGSANSWIHINGNARFEKVGIGRDPAVDLDVNGAARIGSGTDYALFNGGGDGDLQFFGGADYLVGGNKYAFRFSGDEDIGMFFNSTDSCLDVRDGTATAVHNLCLDGDYVAAGEITSSSGASLGDGGTTNYMSISATGDQTFTGTAGFYPRRVSQSAEPANGTGATQIDVGETIIWHDTDTDEIWWMYNDTTAGIKKSQLS